MCDDDSSSSRSTASTAATATTNTSTMCGDDDDRPARPAHHQHHLTDQMSSSSILEFLNHEQRCLLTDTARTISVASATSNRMLRSLADDIAGGHQQTTTTTTSIDEADVNDEEDDDSELDIESIFSEIQRLSGGACRSGGGVGEVASSTSERSVDEILREAEVLIGQQEMAAAAAAAAAQSTRRAPLQMASVRPTLRPVSASSSGRGTTRSGSGRRDGTAAMSVSFAVFYDLCILHTVHKLFAPSAKVQLRLHHARIYLGINTNTISIIIRIS